MIAENLHPGIAFDAEQQTSTGWVRRVICCCDEVDPLVREISQRMTEKGYSSQDDFAVQLSVTEALVNAIRHGNEGDPEKLVRLQYLVLGDHLWIEIEDEGNGFKPEEVPDPCLRENLERGGGRGVFLMKQFMTRVEYSHGGRRVLLSRRRTAVTGAQQT